MPRTSEGPPIAATIRNHDAVPTIPTPTMNAGTRPPHGSRAHHLPDTNAESDGGLCDASTVDSGRAGDGVRDGGSGRGRLRDAGRPAAWRAAGLQLSVGQRRGFPDRPRENA